MMVAAAAAMSAQAPAQNAADAQTAIIDTHVYLSRWPFRRVPHDEPAALAQHLAKQGVRQAWAGSFDALLHDDIATVNERLAETCREHRMFLPIGAVNPNLPAWEEDLRRCHEEHGFAGVRLHPNYHRYTLTDDRCRRLLKAAQERKLLVQIAVQIEDTRTQHPLVLVPPADYRPLANVLRDTPELRVQLLNPFAVANVPALAGLEKLPQVHFEFAWLETIRCVAELVERVGIERICFGSMAPLFYFESAMLKMRESALPPESVRTICVDNPQRLLGVRRA